MVAASEHTGPAGACHCGSPSARPVGRLPLLPAIALVLLPKCPLCLGAWFGLLGLSTTPWLRAAWGTPLWIGLLALPVAMLAVRARGQWASWRMWAGLAGATALLAGKYWTNVTVLCAGFVLLAAASVWSGWSQAIANQSVRRIR